MQNDSNLKRAVVFPGQGTQYVGMGADLFEEFSDLCNLSNEILGYSLEDLCIDERRLSDTVYAQPAIFCVNAFSYLNYLKTNRLPDYLLGHSLGEYNALFAAGVFDFKTALSTVKKRAELMSKAEGGAMVAVIGLPQEAIKESIKNYDVVVANYNSQDQVVLSGKRSAISDIIPSLERLSARCVLLRVSGAFHSPLMEKAGLLLADDIERITFSKFRIPVVSNVTAEIYCYETLASQLISQLTSPVRFFESIKFLLGRGVDDFIEIGNSKILSNLIDKIRG